MRLIVNSDDFGYSRGHNYGIVDCYSAGILRSTTLMNNSVGTLHAYELAKANPGLDVGIHFVLTHGRPLSPAREIPSLVDDKGDFLSLNALQQGQPNPDEVYLEWSRQLERQLAHGVMPSHGDSHHHVHMMPLLFDVYCRLARENQLAIRFYQELIEPARLTSYQALAKEFKQADLFRADFYAENVSQAYFETLPHDQAITVEVMAHPAYLDKQIQLSSSYTLERVEETAILTSDALKDRLASLGIQCISFKEL